MADITHKEIAYIESCFGTRCVLRGRWRVKEIAMAISTLSHCLSDMLQEAEDELEENEE